MSPGLCTVWYVELLLNKAGLTLPKIVLNVNNSQNVLEKQHMDVKQFPV